ncbi:leucyl aminopeptidase [Donghicola eburneus]|uniref:Probable cytosol aminopeptidase n=1 Tax=Donghicola eburneus TaxID=393278 RepID=A0A1M4N2Q5_9RHOB|nr:leucyl aminopeptidase [Donghicola eburneus]SCM68387.1 putative cytosol aminopeptidase [Donghicola eburneus]SFQ23102.1 leucyl aminopeptidase [Donghicola eburneus]
MTQPVAVEFIAAETDALDAVEGRIAVFVGPDGQLDVLARRVNRLSKGAIAKAVGDEKWAKRKTGEVVTLSYPAGNAKAIDIVVLDKKAGVDESRKAGAALARARGTDSAVLCAARLKHPEEVALGAVLRTYTFIDHKTGDQGEAPAGLSVMVNDPKAGAVAYAPKAAIAEGVFFTRDLVSEPANILTTTEFAARLEALSELGVTVEVLEEEQLAELGMRAMLAVGQGSVSPSKLVVMQWNGGNDGDAPLALVGKGVVFDTGGISLKPAGGMEDMTMDMGGAGVVSGVMKTIALRKAKANVVGIVGLVENMPDGNAIRPGDIVRTMKGDTVEIINTDAEGRLVLCDALWYTQERFKPAGVVDLATLTGAIIIGLGHEHAGVFSNNDVFCDSFLKAAKSENEGAWRMPLAPAYDKQIASPIADMKNVGGRPAGSITAAQYLLRFVKEETPWIHLDIAGVASRADHTLHPKGASGWGVMALDRLVRDNYES